MKGNISTKTGDKGTTAIGGGQRVDKDDIRIECLGELDEANSTIGLLRSKLDAKHDWEEGLQRIQTEMMNLMSHVATPSSSVKKPQIPLPLGSAEWMETWLEEIEKTLSSVTEYFLLPGGNEISSLCHTSRTQIRRAERRLVTLNKIDPVDPSILKFVNRLSDLLFKLARQELLRNDITEERWRLFRNRPKSPDETRS
ncbi:MAG: cob(I)yrinic acid a,c-diamide adenosyltransferase [Opitutaceae bacterium]|nr:cob(I)yrinic acid a,c-diamide adenosyltransferase [Opitutaceae bacterium]